MPIYEYVCEHCGHELEKWQKITDSSIIICPKCKYNTLIRLVSSSTFRLKGDGWYESGYNKKESK